MASYNSKLALHDEADRPPPVPPATEYAEFPGYLPYRVGERVKVRRDMNAVCTTDLWQRGTVTSSTEAEVTVQLRASEALRR